MPRTIKTNVTYPGMQAWVDAHGLDPTQYASTVTIEDDGAVTLQRLLTDDQGHHYPDPAGETLASEPVTITPKLPFPD